MSPVEIAALAAGGAFAGVVNTLAGGGSMLTVPLLVMLGLPGTLANGTNRIGILAQNVAAVSSFRRAGVDGLARSLPVLVPVGAGSLIGAIAVSRLADDVFERAFGLVMLLVLAPTLRPPRARAPGESAPPWPRWASALVFFAIGLYGGAFQAGVGIALLLAVARTGVDLVTANAIKVLVVGALTLVAVPVFIASGQVAWPQAAVLTAGFAAGGWLGARVAVRGGDRLIRPVLVVCVLALAGRMLGAY
ncbi:MAG: sulfite exporter TauE/SafE family protein [Myxococcota bacterium]|nr:sulfite exporter TauE/SafE family protein [Myxococcales bacterium]